MTSDIELLGIEIETIWRKDERNRLAEPGAPHLVIAVSTSGWMLALGGEVPEVLAAELYSEISADPPSSNAASAPTAIAKCRRLLGASLGSSEFSGGPSYVIRTGTAFESSADILRSSDGRSASLEGQDIDRLRWDAKEWRQLLDGSLGPWAMAMAADKVIAICHSARLTDSGAEAGVWTDPDFRGQGHAAAVTASWAALLASSGRHLFYSTSAANVSSQRVADRLHLRPIGWLWKVTPTLPG